jgi:glycosyltransferase involved in cell wall biosynthesis
VNSVFETASAEYLQTIRSLTQKIEMKAKPNSPILIVCGAGYVSGKEAMALELGQGLARNGEAVSFITSLWNNGDFVKRLELAGLPNHILPIGFISATFTAECLCMTAEQILHLPGLLWGYARVLRLLNPRKVVHTNWHHALLLLRFLRPDRDLYWLHEFVPDLPQYRRVFGWFAGRLNCFVCVSQAVAGSLRQLGIDETKIRVIHNGITDPVSTGPTRHDAAAFRIGIVGQVGAWKGHEDLLEAFAVVHQKHASSELHVFGNGDATYRGELERKSIELGIANCVRWHEFVSDRREIYSNLDLCVIPSRSQDPLPTTAIEAGFSALPVIATRRGGLPEVIENETNGLLVEARRPAELADAMCRVIEDSQLRRRLASNARRCATERFGSERFLKEFIQLLEEEE